MNRQAQVENLSGWGRGGDTMMAHLTPGEMILPRGVQGDPELMEMIDFVMKKRGLNPDEYVAGHQDAKVNPNTGAQEFYEAAGAGRDGERGYGGGKSTDGRGGGFGGDGKESGSKESAGSKSGGKEGNGGSKRDFGSFGSAKKKASSVSGAHLGANNPAPNLPVAQPAPVQPVAPVTPATPATPTTPATPGTAPVWDSSATGGLPIANLDADTLARLNALNQQQITVPDSVGGEAAAPIYNETPAMSAYGGDVRYLNRVVNRDNGKEEYKYANGRTHAPKWGGGDLYNRLAF